MIPTNGDLFADLTDIERLFIDPTQSPWEGLQWMMRFMQDRMGDYSLNPPREPKEEWPSILPYYKRCETRTPHTYLSVERSLHFRGGWGLKSDPNVYINGPVVFGKNVTIRKGAVVTGPSYIGDNVLIGQGCRVKNSIIRSGTEIQFGTRVAHAVLGRDVFIGANAVLNDRPFDGSEVVYVSTTQRHASGVTGHHTRIHDTGLKELGLIAGDRVRVGGGAVFAPGVILCSETRVEMGARILRCAVYSLEHRPDCDDA